MPSIIFFYRAVLIQRYALPYCGVPIEFVSAIIPYEDCSFIYASRKMDFHIYGDILECTF